MPGEATFKVKIPPAIKNYLKPDAPKDARLLAAKGLVPMAPSMLATALTFLLQDADEEVREAAKRSLLEMPISMVQGIVKEPAHPKTLDFFGRGKMEEEKVVEAIILNPLTPDDTFVYLAEKVNERLASMIATNQVRLLRTPLIAETLRKNTNALKSVLDTMVSFLRISGVVLEGESPELTNEEIKQILNEPEPVGAPPLLPQDLVEEKEEEVTDEKKKSLYQQIQGMAVAQKVKLALKGNKEARSLLIKDSNKIVAAAVIKSPRITDGEVMAIAQMRTSHDEVIRIIAGNPDWMKNYNIQSALANNPKTPFPVAIRIVRQLRPPDLEKLGRNKNVTGQLSKIAKELYEQKRK